MVQGTRERNKAEKRLILATDLIKDCMLACYEELIKSEGSEQVYSAVNPYGINGGFAASLIIKDRLGINKNDPVSVASVWAFMHNAFRRKPDVAIGSDYCISFVRHCSHLSAGPEVCMLECVSVARGVASSFGTDLDFDMTTSIADHDDCCTQIFKIKSISSSKIIMEMTKDKKCEVNLESITDEEALAYYRAYLCEMWLWVIKASIDLGDGEKTLSLFKEKMHRQGLKWSPLLHRELSNSRNHDLDVAELIDEINDLLQQKGKKIVKLNNGNFKEIEVCPFSSAPPEMCKIFEAFINGVITSIDASNRFEYQRTMNRGDASCLWMLSRARI